MTKRRAILAPILGVALWGILWNLGTRTAQAVFPDLLRPDQQITHTGVLLGYIGYSVVLSILAGLVVGTVARARTMTVVWVFAAIQLSLGVIAEVSYWPLMPAWYHLTFLALVVPATVLGGGLPRLVGGQPSPA